MKLSLGALFSLTAVLVFSSCNQRPANEAQDSMVADSGYVETAKNGLDTVVLGEPIVNSLKHYFSDTSQMDSFAIEMPAGNIFTNQIQIKIYNPANNLIFMDSIEPNDFFEDEMYNQGNPQPEVAINDLRRGIMGMFNADNFNYSGQIEEVMKAQGAGIIDMDTWAESVADSTKMIYNFYDSYKGLSFVAYSKKLNKAVVIVREVPNEDRD